MSQPCDAAIPEFESVSFSLVATFFASFADRSRVVAMKATQRKTVKVSTTLAPLEVKLQASPKSSAPTAEATAKRAYELYLARGGEHGHDAEDWLCAEAELSSP
jgi:hypothetical protein